MSKNRHLRSIANNLPPIPKMNKDGMVEKRIEIVILYGSQLIERGILTVKNSDGVKVCVDPKKKYQHTETVPEYVNHFKELRSAFDKHGIAGVDAYIQGVKNFYDGIASELRKEQAIQDAEIAESEVIQ